MARHPFNVFLAVAFALSVSVVMAGPGNTAQQDAIAFVGGTVIDGTMADPISDAIIIVAGDRIEQVGRAAALDLPEGVQTINVTGKWLIPGLVDAHVHFFQSASLYTRPDVIDLRRVRPYAEETTWIRNRIPLTLARYIASGVTSVVDLAGPTWTFEVRDYALRSQPSPRVLVTGPGLAPTTPKALMTDDSPGVTVRTPREAREQVGRLLERKSDLLKIWFPYSSDMDLDQEMEWVRAAVEAAHAHELRVAAHATQRELAREMVRAGVDILVHSVDDVPVDDAFVNLLSARDTLYITTLVVGEGYQEVLGQHVSLTGIERRVGDPEVIASFADLPRLFPWIRRTPVTRPDSVALKNLKRLQDAGVTVVAGSDAGNIGTLHGPALHRELELMHAAGLAPKEILVAATSGGARVMGREGELGTIEPGKLADFVILDADPLIDIRNTRRIHRVVKGGKIYDPDEILKNLSSR
jgi:imidazolonepropionase-like amidohydrolase